MCVHGECHLWLRNFPTGNMARRKRHRGAGRTQRLELQHIAALQGLRNAEVDEYERKAAMDRIKEQGSDMSQNS